MSNLTAVPGALMLLLCTLAHATPTALPGQPLTADEVTTVTQTIALIKSNRLMPYSDLAEQLYKKGKIRAAKLDDPWIAGSEKAGDTPFAYTLPDDHHPHRPEAIVLAPRFFTQTTGAARASILLHELGHWQAYAKIGRSDEYDGYKAEYDTYKQIGLTQFDGLTYFMMLDGVVEYVVPKSPSYKDFSDVKAYMSAGP